MSQLNKQDLENLLRPQLGNDLIVESLTSKPLTQPGENYGSTMLALDVNVIRGGNKQTLPLVAKLAPPSEFLWKLFDTPNTFCKEIDCYTKVKAEYENIQKEKNVPQEDYLDIFPKCYGARTTLDLEIGNLADENAVLLLENLKTSNYTLGDRIVGLDLDHTKLVVSQLARFHAVSVAIKIHKPHVFERTVLRACKLFNPGLTREEMEKNNISLTEQIKAIPECRMYAEKLKQMMDESMEKFLNNTPDARREPFGALGHEDLWVNNMMFCYDTNNKPTGVKFLDFQGVKYGSPAKDLIFFLYSSTADGVIESDFGMFIQLYYQSFISCLRDLDCDVTPFTFESFVNEIDEVAPEQGPHIFFMLRVICANKQDVPQLADVKSDSILSAPNEIFNKRAKRFILDFAKRGWL